MDDVGMTMDVMDVVMLNTNRDHPSVAELGVEKGDEARKLFALLVGISRARICENLAHVYGLTSDAQEFERIHEEQAHHLKDMTSGEVPRQPRRTRLSGIAKGLKGWRKNVCSCL